MRHVIKLINQIKTYAWGSPQWIPQLMDRKNSTGEPWAELWMGVHPQGPSVLDIPGEQPLLSDFIGKHPEWCLGEAAGREFGALPFLFKLLAAAKPLSVQAHPNLAQARAGFDRENNAGLSPDDPVRNYKDPHHKPEILCALSPFRAMCGFREPEAILHLLKTFSRDAATRPGTALNAGLTRLRETLGTGEDEGALRHFLTALFDLPGEFRRELTVYTLEQELILEKAVPRHTEIWQTAAYFARLYPGDPAVIAPLYLNLISLAPGEAIYLPAGILHAYIEGLGVELMADSDNVLRGGLTPKHVDAEELARILECRPFFPALLRPSKPIPAVFTYPTDCREFSLSVIRGKGEAVSFPVAGPAIVLVTEGRAVFSCDDGTGGPAETLTLERGESAFITFPEKGAIPRCSGSFTLYVAGTGVLPSAS
ncbi:MAG: mannose-6-phosphate isomerase, class I [Treponema sp.]|jgi:mannose-6-phosphate isomerase|nr:mannose-6-phosphate isomerase, class I [Treponema sp.]